MRMLLPLLGLLFLGPPAQAGEHRPLCEKVKAADLVFEMHFTQKGRYPSSYRARMWAPPREELEKTARTGKVVQTLKGSLETGSPWTPAYPISFTVGSMPQDWDAFFKRPSFTRIYFLARKGESWQGTGWAEESAGCKSSAHWSWCPEYEALKTKIKACLAPAE